MLFIIVVGDGQGIIQIPVDIGIVICLIRELLIRDGLDLGIQGGVDAQAAGGHHVLSSDLGIARGDQVSHDLVIERVGKVGAGGGVTHLVIDIVEADAVIDLIRVRDGLIIFCLGDKIQFPHFLQAFLTSFRVELRMPDGVVCGRVLGDAGNDGALGDCQLRTGFAEIAQGGSLHAQGILPQVDGVHIAQQHVVLGGVFGQLQRQVLLLQLTFDHLDHVVVFFCPGGKDRVFQKLLGNGAGSLLLGSLCLEELVCGADDTLHVNAVMLVKPFVLDGYEGLSQPCGNLVDGHIDPVGVHADILVDLISFFVIYDSGLARGDNIADPDAGRVLQNAAEYADAGGASADTEAKYAYQYELHAGED